MLKCWSCSLVPGLPRQLSSLAVRITGRSVIRIASDDTCGGGLGTRLHVMHEGSHICRFANAKLLTFELILKKVEFSAVSDTAGLRNNEFTYHGLIAEIENVLRK